MRCGRKNLFFFQNGAAQNSRCSVLDGQGHVTAIHLPTLRVSEIVVPTPRVRVSLTDILKRKFWMFFVHTLFNLEHVHTGTANTAVLRTAHGAILAVEEASKPFQLVFDAEGTRIVGGHWLFGERPIAAHSAKGISNFTYSPFRPKALEVDGEQVDVKFERGFPFMVHSCVSVQGADELIVMPIMSARFGNFFKYARGELSMPVDESRTSEWLVWNRTDGRTTFVDTHAITNPLHVVAARREQDTIVVYSSHVKSSFSTLLSQTAAELRPALELRKDVIDVATMELRGTRVFREASGDFPNHIGKNLYVINRLRGWNGEELVYFDIRRDEVVRRVVVETGARDVLYHDGQLLFCTLEHFVVCDAHDGRLLTKVPIPKRATNFHASLLEL
jgi:hypothetical protein